MKQVLLASHNARKLKELRRILEDELPDIEVLGLADVDSYDEPVETEYTFEGNALIKARAAVKVTGLPALADDSGICLDALNGMPGVLSARWAGLPKADRGVRDAANNRLLLAQMGDIPDSKRQAEFRCAVAFVLPDGNEHLEIGVLRGRLLREPHGRGGFGYDPIFLADGQKVSNGELSAAAKDAISHRGAALRSIAPIVVKALAS
ncbi:MAG TPA: RdgB/HAM1 family non-canonical purine NTP pyrophosphatase [Nocardioidaceae bacterium]|nr:RdgB/HAM1 family non-canonical purine NTP pyrophosphatase [Nocardioidaceae bacterium]